MSKKVMEICDWIEKKAQHFGDYSNVIEDFKALCDMEKEIAIKDEKPFNLQSHEYRVSTGCTRLQNLKRQFENKKK